MSSLFICVFEIFHNKNLGEELHISFKRITAEHIYLIFHLFWYFLTSYLPFFILLLSTAKEERGEKN